MLPEMRQKVEHCAQICHEANRLWCAANGDTSQPTWADAPQWQKESAIKGVLFHINNPAAGPNDSHDSWLAEKERDGWRYGEVKDPEAKTHPCFRPYHELPPEQRFKDALFTTIVRAYGNEPPLQFVWNGDTSYGESGEHLDLPAVHSPHQNEPD